MTARAPFKVLLLCTGNSARSILAEYLLRRLGGGGFETYSAGASPNGQVHPLALKVLRERLCIEPIGARSKSWDEYRDVRFNFVITVCDRARESCPVWPGQPIVAHWNSPDPAAVEGTEAKRERAFAQVAMELARRLEFFCALPLEKLDRFHQEHLTRSIGEDARSRPTLESP